MAIAALGLGAPSVGCLGAGSDASSSDASPADVATAREGASHEAGPGREGGLPADASGGGASSFEAGGAGGPVGALRVANLSADAPPIDLCIAPRGTAVFQGPFVSQAAGVSPSHGAAADAATVGIAFGQVSKYLVIKPGPYDARLVVGGATDCAASIAGDPSPLPLLVAGGFETVFLVGDANALGSAPGLKIYGVVDDAMQPSPTDGGPLQLAVRFLHAAPGAAAPVDVNLGGQLLFPRVAFGQIDSATDAGPGIDRNGYVSEGALNTTMSVQLSGMAFDAGAPLASAKVVSATGAALTIALVDAPSDSGATQQGLIQCLDRAETTSLVSTCTVLR